MQNGWTTTKLGDHIQTLKGYAFKSQWYSDIGVPLVKVTDFTGDAIDTTRLMRVPNEIAVTYSKYELKTGDVVIQTVGSWPTNPQSVVGKVIRVPRQANGSLLNQNAVKIIPGELVDKTFLFYALRSLSFKNYITGCAQGAASQASITLDAIRNYDFSFPNLEHQRRIAAILSAYDDLIENNTRRIQILEEMARRIYEEWFVRFRFPGHENVTMVESELGLLPASSEVNCVTQMIEFDPRTTVPREGMKPFVPMSSLAENSMLITNIESRAGNGGSKFKNGDTLLARITPCLENGKTGFVDFLPDDKSVAFGSTEYIVLRSKTVTPEFVYLTARSERFRQHAIKSMSGATGRQRVRVDSFNEFQLVQPDKDALDKFSEVMSPTFKAISCLSKKNENLRQTRDLLLPKLISGEIDVSNFPEPE